MFHRLMPACVSLDHLPENGTILPHLLGELVLDQLGCKGLELLQQLLLLQHPLAFSSRVIVVIAFRFVFHLGCVVWVWSGGRDEVATLLDVVPLEHDVVGAKGFQFGGGGDPGDVRLEEGLEESKELRASFGVDDEGLEEHEIGAETLPVDFGAWFLAVEEAEDGFGVGEGLDGEWLGGTEEVPSVAGVEVIEDVVDLLGDCVGTQRCSWACESRFHAWRSLCWSVCAVGCCWHCGSRLHVRGSDAWTVCTEGCCWRRKSRLHI